VVTEAGICFLIPRYTFIFIRDINSKLTSDCSSEAHIDSVSCRNVELRMGQLCGLQCCIWYVIDCRRSMCWKCSANINATSLNCKIRWSLTYSRSVNVTVHGCLVLSATS